MKFLTFSDTHEDFDQVKKLLQRAKDKEVDFILVPGDFTVFNNQLKKTLDLLNSAHVPVYILPGNHEHGEEFDQEVINHQNITNFHESHFTFKDKESGEEITFLGYGTDGFSTSDANFRKLARKWYGNFKGKRTVMVTHGPPANTKLDKLDNRHVGNMDYRKAIERIKPELYICGHLHETMGEQDEINETILINPCWEGAIIEL